MDVLCGGNEGAWTCCVAGRRRMDVLCGGKAAEFYVALYLGILMESANCELLSQTIRRAVAEKRTGQDRTGQDRTGQDRTRRDGME